MKTIVITGASGFIGGRSADRLVEAGYRVIATGRGEQRPRTMINPEIEYRAAHFDDVAKLKTDSEGVWGILHCAGKAGAWGSYADFYEANVDLTQRLVDAARRAGVERFVNLSSPSIYFDYKDQLRLTEEFRPPRFFKRLRRNKIPGGASRAPSSWARFPSYLFAPAGVIGAGDVNWMPRIISLRKSGGLKQIGDGRNEANFTSVSNLLDAIELAFSVSETATGQVYNIHNGVDEKFWDVVDKGLRAVNLDSRRKKVTRTTAMFLARAERALECLARHRKRTRTATGKNWRQYLLHDHGHLPRQKTAGLHAQTNHRPSPRRIRPLVLPLGNRCPSTFRPEKSRCPRDTRYLPGRKVDGHLLGWG
jgi:nucleoside-diphosphate-sugar epimerase